MSAKIRAADIRTEYEDLDKDKLLDEVVDKVLENDLLPNLKVGVSMPQHDVVLGF